MKVLNQKEWLILNYMLPKEKSSVRVSVWRKLKKCGSVSIGQSMWVLPISEQHSLKFHEIAKEIKEHDGIVFIAEANFCNEGNSEDIIHLLNKARDDEYQEFLDNCEDYFQEIDRETKKNNFTFAELEENEDEYQHLSQWLTKIKQRDFFDAPLKKHAEEAFDKCTHLFDEFSSKIYKANEH